MKNSSSTLLKSSVDLGWSFLSAELRTHCNYEGPGAAALPNPKVRVVVRSSDGEVGYKFAGRWQSARPTTGSIWLMPIGGICDEVHVAANSKVLHLSVPNSTFVRLTDDYLPPAAGCFIRHACGVRDELIYQIALSVLSEMTSPTAAGRMLVETASLLLAARLAHSHLETELIRPPVPSRHRLDEGRLRRVLEYVEEHLAEDISVADLANVASLSLFHFTRAFAATVGMPPPSLRQQSAAGICEEADCCGKGVDERDCFRLPVLLTIKFRSCLSTGDGHDASGIPAHAELRGTPSRLEVRTFPARRARVGSRVRSKNTL